MARAEAKMIRITPRKTRLVCDLVRGKKIADAFNTLEYTNKSAALPVLKVIKSAVANAVNNEGKDMSRLYVKTIFANEGATLKRFMPRAKGRAYEILKRTSHIVVVVDEK